MNILNSNTLTQITISLCHAYIIINYYIMCKKCEQYINYYISRIKNFITHYNYFMFMYKFFIEFFLLVQLYSKYIHLVKNIQMFILNLFIIIWLGQISNLFKSCLNNYSSLNRKQFKLKLLSRIHLSQFCPVT